MITLLLQFVLLGLAAALAIPSLVFAAEIFGALRARAASVMPAAGRGRFAVLTPAHNEARLIGRTIASVVTQLRTGDRMLVVADNCQDDTAIIARAAGAEVVERVDAELRGKGFALARGVDHLRQDPPDIVIVVDADCEPAPGSLEALAASSARSGRPVQGLYLMRGASGNRKMRIAEFAWLVKNHVRPLGLLRLGFGCQLMGTGMAFPWDLIARADLASGHIVEDMKLGLELAQQGAAPLFQPDALITSEFPTAQAGVAGQRTRWEHGHLGMIMSHGPRTLWQAVATRDGSLLALALDLCVPPLALLILSHVALLAICVLFALFTHRLAPALVAGADLALLGIAVFAAWWRFGRAIVSLGDIAGAALYAFAKVPMYVGFVFTRQMTWVRSKRDGE